MAIADLQAQGEVAGVLRVDPELDAAGPRLGVLPVLGGELRPGAGAIVDPEPRQGAEAPLVPRAAVGILPGVPQDAKGHPHGCPQVEIPRGGAGGHPEGPPPRRRHGVEGADRVHAELAHRLPAPRPPRGQQGDPQRRQPQAAAPPHQPEGDLDPPASVIVTTTTSHTHSALYPYR